MWLKSTAAWRKRGERVQRLVDHDALGNVQQRAAGPAGGVQRGEFVGVQIDGAEQMLVDQIAVLANQFVETAEEHALLGPLRHSIALTQFDGSAVERRCAAGKLNAVRQQSRRACRLPPCAEADAAAD